GHTVNLASRVQGATRYFKADVLVTQSTRSQLDDCFAVRRLGQAKLVHIEDAVTLFELVASPPACWSGLKQGYEEALDCFERREFRQASRILGNLLPDFPDDGPSLQLLARAVGCMVDEPAQFSPQWDVNRK